MKRLVLLFLSFFSVLQVSYAQLSADSQKIEDFVKAQIDSSYTDRIEGIYKALKGPYTPYYRLGIYKEGRLYRAVVIESESRRWRPGDTKGYFEPIGNGSYSVKWYMGDKSTADIFGGFDSTGFLKVLTSAANSDDATFVKLYPTSTPAPISTKPGGRSNKPNDSPVASGTGFLISKDGFIATNAHVIDGANAITVDLLDEEEKVHQYKAEITKVDKANDVAVIRINDNSFVPLQDLPYSIESRVNIGASVFTIGFPLNTVMGTNFKVSDGIISAKTGIDDDVRYYQISVPIQPGNSGGPLFNKSGNIVGLTTSRLNGDYLGMHIENVNYAIKSVYLLNLIDMIPNFSESFEASKLSQIDFEQQIDVLKRYVCLIRIY